MRKDGERQAEEIAIREVKTRVEFALKRWPMQERQQNWKKGGSADLFRKQAK
jgi:hypothetical protein